MLVRRLGFISITLDALVLHLQQTAFVQHLSDIGLVRHLFIVIRESVISITIRFIYRRFNGCCLN